ncbi:MAG TPA: 30S ribosomal protein S16, partial [Aquificaceae bacterium]|nr:30S ribosomal protein S16 [Aquificaceae bacterium]
LSHRAKAILWNHGILKEVIPEDYEMKRVGDYYVFEKRKSQKSKGGEEV